MPPLVNVLTGAVKKITGKTALVVSAGIKTGMNILIDEHATLGSDLVADGVAAMAHYKLPVIVFDMGTATTISVIDQNGNFIGGALFPGVQLSMNALASGTSQLPRVPIEPTEKVICANTIDCMKSGAIYGTASMIDGMIERVEEELGMKATAVATGGLSGDRPVLPSQDSPRRKPARGPPSSTKRTGASKFKRHGPSGHAACRFTAAFSCPSEACAACRFACCSTAPESDRAGRTRPPRRR